MIPSKPPTTHHGRRHDEVDNPRKLFVGGISRDTLQAEFREYFAQFGELEDCVVMIDQVTQKSRGFGFVVFMHQQTVDDVLSRSSQNSLVLRGRTLDCKKAVPRSKQNPHFNKSRSYHQHQHQSHSHYNSHSRHDQLPRGGAATVPPSNPYYSSSPQQPQQHSHYNGQFRKTRSKYANKSNKIFVGGFSDDFTDKTLLDHFSKYGIVADAMVMIDKEGNSRKFGFVTMQNAADADAAVFEGDREIDGVHVTVQRAIPKDEMGDVPRRPMKKSNSVRHPMYDGQSQSQAHMQSYPMHPNMYAHAPQAPPPIYPPSAYPQYGQMAPQHSHHPQLQYAHLPPSGSSYPAYSSYPNQAAYQYSYPQTQMQPQMQAQVQQQLVKSNEDPRNANANVQNASQNVDVKKEEGDKGQEKNVSAAVPVTAQQQMYGAPRYNEKGIYVAPPVHAPAQYGTYQDVKTHAGQYGATRGQLASTRTYNPY